MGAAVWYNSMPRKLRSPTKGIVGMEDLTEKTIATERKYTGKIISVDLLDIELPDGRKAKRGVIRHGNACDLASQGFSLRSSGNPTPSGAGECRHPRPPSRRQVRVREAVPQGGGSGSCRGNRRRTRTRRRPDGVRKTRDGGRDGLPADERGRLAREVSADGR